MQWNAFKTYMMLGLGCNMKILMLVELTYLCVINEWPVTVTSFVPSVHIMEFEFYVDFKTEATQNFIYCYNLILDIQIL